jgi:hypothetical protein
LLNRLKRALRIGLPKLGAIISLARQAQNDFANQAKSTITIKFEKLRHTRSFSVLSRHYQHLAPGFDLSGNFSLS